MGIVGNISRLTGALPVASDLEPVTQGARGRHILYCSPSPSFMKTYVQYITFALQMPTRTRNMLCRLSSPGCYIQQCQLVLPFVPLSLSISGRP
jgi:hypothetical protein